MERTPSPIVVLAALGAPADSSSASRIDDGLSSSAETSAWQEVVRKFPDSLSKVQKATFLQQGELIIVYKIRREEFLGSLRGEEDGFARGMEWRVVDAQPDAEIGELVVTTLPCAPHERAEGALKRAFWDFVARNTTSPEIAGTIVDTGSTRYSAPTRSAEADGGFTPKNSPRNAATGEGMLLLWCPHCSFPPVDIDVVVIFLCVFSRPHAGV